jgi:hypothetical protein
MRAKHRPTKKQELIREGMGVIAWFGLVWLVVLLAVESFTRWRW